MDVNNADLIENIQNNLNYQASRILDKVRETSENIFENLEELFETTKAETIENYGIKEGKRKIIEAKRKVSWKVVQKEKTLKLKMMAHGKIEQLKAFL